MRLLFICSKNVNIKSSGGEQCTNRNFLSFCELLGSKNVHVIDLISEGEKSIFWSISRRINLIFGFYYGLSHNTLTNILKTSKKYDYVFIDTSVYGIIASHLKKEKYNGKIICFFHNVEYNIKLQKAKKNPVNFLLSYVIYHNEKAACRYADKIVVLNKRDNSHLIRRFGVMEVSIIPVSLSDSVKDQVRKTTSLPPTLLFIGNNWFANVHGLKWFVKNVLDFVNIKLQIVGSDMDKLKRDFVHPKIEFLGYVSDLSSLIMEADYLICPIFIGGGMKVKICEALMYGKNIIGTKESFEGYEIDYTKVGVICSNKEEFISAIKNYCSIIREKFNDYNRKCFLENYSFQATLGKFEKLLSK
jgi:polysaccharide biosynthesis protein PslH